MSRELKIGLTVLLLAGAGVWVSGLLPSQVVIRAHQNGDKMHAAEVKIGTSSGAADHSIQNAMEAK